ncbi:MAG: PAS domain S-box protein [Gloeobacteraceae cyanobacterium ES-bin-316]|nr:PAS domain S-box protein [Ferruginibacter sp.]
MKKSSDSPGLHDSFTQANFDVPPNHHAGRGNAEDAFSTYTKAFAAVLREPILILDRGLTVVYANKSFLKTFQLVENETHGTLLYELGNKEWELPALRKLLEKLIERGEGFENFEVDFNNPQLGAQSILLNGREVTSESGTNKLLLLSFGDVTERRIVERKILSNEERFRNLLLQSPFAVGLFKGENMLIDLANEALKEMWGKGSAVEGQSLFEVLPELGPGIKTLLRNVLQTGEPYVGIEQLVKINRNGILTDTYYNFVYQPYHEADGNISGVVDIAYEVTEQVLARKKMEESEERFRNLSDQSPMFVYIVEANAEATMSYFNKTWLDYTGQTFKEALGRAWDGIVHPDEVQGVMDIYIPAFIKREAYTLPALRLKRHDGVYRWHSFKGNPRFLPNGDFNGYVGVGLDIHESKIASEKLQASEIFNRTVLENSPDCVKILDAEGHIQYINLNGLSIMEIDDFSAYKDKAWMKECGNEYSRLFAEGIRKAVIGETTQFQALCKTAKGTPKWWDVMISPILESGNETVTSLIAVSRDITEQRRIQSLLEYRKALLEAHNEASLDGILLVDAKGKILSFNKRFMEVWDMPQHIVDAKDDDAALAHAMQQLVNPEQFLEKVKFLYENPLETSNDTLEFKSGKLVHRHGYPVVAEDGSYYAWSWNFRDITKEKSVQTMLEYRKALLEAHTESSADGILLADDKGKIISFNKRYIEIWNMPVEVATSKDDALIVSHTLSMLVNPEKLAEKNRQLYANPLEKGSILLEFKDGKIIERQNYPVLGEDGSFYGVSLTYKDVTEITKAQFVLQQSEENFRQLAELMPDMVSTADARGEVTYYSKNWTDYTGISRERLYPEGWVQLMHPDDQENVEKRWKYSVETGEDFETELRVLSKTGHYKWHLSRASAIKDEMGRVLKWIGSMTEIQKIKEEEERKGDFIKMVSHELKTPVTSIKGYVQLLLTMLQQKEDSKISSLPIKPSLERIDKQILRLTRLITEMLDLSRLEENKLDLKKEKLLLNDLVNETVQDMQFTHSSHTIRVKHDFTATVDADKDRIQQVLINFITNAIKYSPDKNSIEVSIQKLDKNSVKVSVQDFGIGIAKTDQKRIFERFYRVSGDNEDHFSGFGIGLFIANQIIERHQGTISVESEIGKGAFFAFTLPLNNQP